VQGEYVEDKEPETWDFVRKEATVGSLSESLSGLSVSDGTDVGGKVRSRASESTDLSSVRLKQAARRKRPASSGLARGFLL